MGRLHRGSGRLWRAAHRVANGSLLLALVVTLLVGVALGRSTLVTAQSLTQGQNPTQQDPTHFPATGYRISAPELFTYFQQRGGVRTFGLPVSNDFPLLGHRIQIFQRHVLELRADGSVTPVNILDPDVMPLSRFDGLNLPPINPNLLGAAPPLDSPDYQMQALAFVNTYVPDQWEGASVNFLSTYLSTVTCADAFPGEESCDPAQLGVYALEVWGLPTSEPTADPLNSDFVYQRFQRGIMHFSRATGLTQGLLVGDWFKRVMLGINLAPDIGPEIQATRFFGQYAPGRPLGLNRPDELPDTSLAQAFRADTLNAALQPEPTLPPSVAQTATAVAATATVFTATQVAFEGTQAALTLTPAAVPSTPTVMPGTPVPTSPPPSPVSDIPVSNEGCMGDEQMWFVPRKPFAGTRVEITVTSRRHHDVRFLRLVGPLDTGTPIEHLSIFGFAWTWTVTPTAVDQFHDWVFYADGLRPCITSGFTAYPPLGATATPTNTVIPTDTPGTATATPRPTPLPVPVITNSSFTSTCNAILQISGNNFGSPPSANGTGAWMTIGGTTYALDTIGTGSNTQLRVQMPLSIGGPTSGTGLVFVSSAEADSNLVPITVSGC